MSAPATSTKSERITAIDVLRGITVAGMLVVNDPGDAAHVFAPFAHSVWNGCTLADLVFPFFLFVVGITTHLSLSRRSVDGADNRAVTRAILRRSAIIFGLGLLLNAYPFFEKNAVAGPDWLPAFLGHIGARLEQLRIMGVLQRIAIAYLVTSFIVRRASTRTVVLTTAGILLAYWGAMTILPVPGEGVIGRRCSTIRGAIFPHGSIASRLIGPDGEWDGTCGIAPFRMTRKDCFQPFLQLQP